MDAEQCQTQLQEDLSALEEWSNIWQMSFNTDKCYVLGMCKKGADKDWKYKLGGKILKSVDNQPYLGEELQSNLKWVIHINNIANKANQALGFICRNLYMCPLKVKVTVYHTLVRPHLDYRLCFVIPSDGVASISRPLFGVGGSTNRLRLVYQCRFQTVG